MTRLDFRKIKDGIRISEKGFVEICGIKDPVRVGGHREAGTPEGI